jgi:hypothetical protein
MGSTVGDFPDKGNWGISPISENCEPGVIRFAGRKLSAPENFGLLREKLAHGRHCREAIADDLE